MTMMKFYLLVFIPRVLKLKTRLCAFASNLALKITQMDFRSTDMNWIKIIG